MNTGVISRRYATALLKYVTESGHGEQVYAQVKALLNDPDTAPKPLCEDLQKFSALLVQNGRMPLVKLVFSSFLQQYETAAGIHVARLKTAVDSPELQEKLQAFDQMVTEKDLLNGKYLLVQQGKKKYFLLTAE